MMRCSTEDRQNLRPASKPVAVVWKCGWQSKGWNDGIDSYLRAVPKWQRGRRWCLFRIRHLVEEKLRGSAARRRRRRQESRSILAALTPRAKSKLPRWRRVNCLSQQVGCSQPQVVRVSKRSGCPLGPGSELAFGPPFAAVRHEQHSVCCRHAAWSSGLPLFPVLGLAGSRHLCLCPASTPGRTDGRIKVAANALKQNDRNLTEFHGYPCPDDSSPSKRSDLGAMAFPG